MGIVTYKLQDTECVPVESVIDAVIRVEPALIPVTTPLLTVATFVLLELQVSVASAGYVVAVIVFVEP